MTHNEKTALHEIEQKVDEAINSIKSSYENPEAERQANSAFKRHIADYRELMGAFKVSRQLYIAKQFHVSANFKHHSS